MQSAAYAHQRYCRIVTAAVPGDSVGKLAWRLGGDGLAEEGGKAAARWAYSQPERGDSLVGVPATDLARSEVLVMQQPAPEHGGSA